MPRPVTRRPHRRRRRPGLLGGDIGVAPDELAGVGLDRPVQPGVDRRRRRRDVLAVQGVAHLQAQGVARARGPRARRRPPADRPSATGRPRRTETARSPAPPCSRTAPARRPRAAAPSSAPPVAQEPPAGADQLAAVEVRHAVDRHGHRRHHVRGLRPLHRDAGHVVLDVADLAVRRRRLDQPPSTAPAFAAFGTTK